jgi:dihydroxyacetone kinase
MPSALLSFGAKSGLNAMGESLARGAAIPGTSSAGVTTGRVATVAGVVGLGGGGGGGHSPTHLYRMVEIDPSQGKQLW